MALAITVQFRISLGGSWLELCELCSFLRSSGVPSTPPSFSCRVRSRDCLFLLDICTSLDYTHTLCCPAFLNKWTASQRSSLAWRALSCPHAHALVCVGRLFAHRYFISEIQLYVLCTAEHYIDWRIRHTKAMRGEFAISDVATSRLYSIMTFAPPGLTRCCIHAHRYRAPSRVATRSHAAVHCRFRRVHALCWAISI